MAEIFVISDTHFGHANILKFLRKDGTRLRNFSSLEEMTQQIIDNWNRVVRPQDKVYHCGDVAMGNAVEELKVFDRLMGHKRLVRGNHDLLDTKVYLKYFDDVYGVRQLNGVWLTHVPMHLDSAEAPRVKVNIHGHLHANVIDHPKYFNASVECINYTPISIDEVLKKVKQ